LPPKKNLWFDRSFGHELRAEWLTISSSLSLRAEGLSEVEGKSSNPKGVSSAGGRKGGLARFVGAKATTSDLALLRLGLKRVCE